MPKSDFFASEDFMSMDQMQRLNAIHENPGLYSMEIMKRRKLLNQIVEEAEGYTKANNEGIRVSNTGSHSDITASIAMKNSEYKVLLNDDATYMQLKSIEPDSYAIEVFLALRLSMYLYEKVIELFPDETIEILKMRMNNDKVTYIANKLDRSRGYVGNRITFSYMELESKAREVFDMYNIK